MRSRKLTNKDDWIADAELIFIDLTGEDEEMTEDAEAKSSSDDDMDENVQEHAEAETKVKCTQSGWTFSLAKRLRQLIKELYKELEEGARAKSEIQETNRRILC
uniref:Uncharacterized protein n=1 Tax=Ditylenchus dipsaci TaxID=166011 RepID=A0A915EKV9_9BILA